MRLRRSDIFALRQKRYSGDAGSILRFAQRYVCFANAVLTANRRLLLTPYLIGCKIHLRIDFEVYEKIYLLTAYPKNEKDNLTKAERNELRELVKVLENQLRESEE